MEGNAPHMDKAVKVADVSGYRTKSGNIRFVLRGEDGNEYTTFKESTTARRSETGTGSGRFPRTICTSG